MWCKLVSREQIKACELCASFTIPLIVMLCSIPSVYHNSRKTNVLGIIVESACVSVWPSMCWSAYKILVILCFEIPLQFCFKCIRTLQIHWSHIEILQGAILNIDFFIAYFCQSAGGGNKSHSVTVLVLKLRRRQSLVSVVWEAPLLHGKILSNDRQCAFVEKGEFINWSWGPLGLPFRENLTKLN